MRSKTPRRELGGSSIYWNSVDSSGESSGSDNRNYVDPWDLENYAYLRRHSIATTSFQPIYQTSQRSSRMSHRSPLNRHHDRSFEPDYWYAPAIREPGYDAPASVEEIYFRPPRPVSSGYCYPQAIYEDEATSHYAAPLPLYSYLSELEQAEALEGLRTREMLRRRNKVTKSRIQSSEECFYHRRPNETIMMEAPSRFHYTQDSVDEVGTIRYPDVINPHITLNTYGYLKIDYTNSWNLLHSKIASK